ncbi:MAG: phosphopyruvate hydratase [Proteobacteria bacterium]|nr:phosphopyruvate hydratase [Pseudomonadota bacterium]MBU1686693.1 phosphopyruvate hydratase [Pseudomonadota bacterium]
MAKIIAVKARQILDSRGNPTVEADVITDGGHLGRAAVPSGASTGTREALELRDGDPNYYNGKSVRRAVASVKEKIAPHLIGMDPTHQSDLDHAMCALDGTEDKSSLGANAILAVSLAACRVGALGTGLPLYRYLHEVLSAPNKAGLLVLPFPMMNIINGGQHAANNLDIQEFMIVPQLQASFSENLRAGVEVFHRLKKVLAGRNLSTNVGDEGGFAPSLDSHDQAIQLILQAIEEAHYQPGRDIFLALDAASSEFYRNGHYHMEGREFSTNQMIDYYTDLVERYPLFSIEDGLAEQDGEGWPRLTQKLGNRILIIGDDLFVTNPNILKEGIIKKQANAVLIKVNQIGTLTETLETMAIAYDAGLRCIISHRSGETSDAFIADLAVATGAGLIKTGSASRTDRLAKYNQLLRIEEQLTNDGNSIGAA